MRMRKKKTMKVGLRSTYIDGGGGEVDIVRRDGGMAWSGHGLLGR